MRGLSVAVVVAISGLVATPAFAADGVAVVRTGGTVLNVRTGPGTSSATVGTVRPGTRLTIACQVAGQRIRGAVSTTAQWDLLATGGHRSHPDVSGGPPLARGATPAPAGGPRDPPPLRPPPP